MVRSFASNPIAREYNLLRTLALEAQPGLDERLLGPILAVTRGRKGREVSQAGCQEIELYARQILTLFTSHVSTAARQSLALPPRGGAPLSAEEEQNLVAAFDAGASLTELAEFHQRSEGGIRSRLMRHGRLDALHSDRRSELLA